MLHNENTLILNGIGGIGKSELLNYWVNQARKKAIAGIHYDNIVYLSCSEGIANALEKATLLRKALGIPDSEVDKLALLQMALQGYPNLLIVLDDLPWEKGTAAQTQQDLSKLNLTASIIATSRSKGYYEHFEALSIGTLDKDKCIELFNKHCQKANTSEANQTALAQIIEYTGRHTLMVELFGKTARALGKDATGFLQTLEKEGFDIDTSVAYSKDNEYFDDSSVIDALAKLFDIAGLKKKERQIMYHLACMDSQPFTFDTVQQWLKLADKTPLTTLQERGWLQTTQAIGGQDGYQLHQTITHAVKNYFAKNKASKHLERMQSVGEAMQAYYQAQAPDSTNTACLSAIGAYLTQMLLHLDGLASEEKINFTDYIIYFAKFCRERAQFQLGKQTLENNLETFKTQLGENHPDYATTLNNLALLYQVMGDYEKALPLYLQAQATRKAVLDENHPDYATSLNNLAGLYWVMGDYKKALPLFQQAQAIRKAVLGEQDPDYATSLNNLAIVYQAMGDYEKALPLYLQAQAIRKAVWGEHHPDYAVSLNNLAELYREIGNYEKALPLHQQSQVIRKTVLGEHHPDYASSLNNLALVYEAMGNYEKALPLYLQNIAITKEILGEQHPSYATSLNNLAGLYGEMGDYEKALPLYQQAGNIFKENLNENHPDYAISLNNLAGLYEKMGDYEKALPLYLQAQAIRKTVLGEQHPDYATSLNNLAGLYEKMGDYEKALPLYLQSQAIRKAVWGEHHPDYAVSLNNLAELYREIGNYEKALPLYLQAIAILEKSLGQDHPNTQICKDNYQIAKAEAEKLQ